MLEGQRVSNHFLVVNGLHRSIGFQFILLLFAVLVQVGLINIFCFLPPHYLTTALIVAEDLAAQQPSGPIDATAIANNIAYYDDGLGKYLLETSLPIIVV